MKNIVDFDGENPFVTAANLLYRSEFNGNNFLKTINNSIPYNILI